jgi:hypothetical protein
MNATYVNRTVEAVDCYDSTPVPVEVTASVGEFDGVMIGLTMSDGFKSVELTVEQAELLRTALDDAITCLTKHQ